MNGRVEDVRPSAERLRVPAGLLVPFDDRDPQARPGQQGGGREPAEAASDDHHVAVSGRRVAHDAGAGFGAVQSQTIPAYIHLVASTPMSATR